MVIVLELSTTSSGVGNDQIKVVLGEGLTVGFCQFSCSDAISAVNMQCPAATLLFRNNDVVAMARSKRTVDSCTAASETSITHPVKSPTQ